MALLCSASARPTSQNRERSPRAGSKSCLSHNIPCCHSQTIRNSHVSLGKFCGLVPVPTNAEIVSSSYDCRLLASPDYGLAYPADMPSWRALGPCTASCSDSCCLCLPDWLKGHQQGANPSINCSTVSTTRAKPACECQAILPHSPGVCLLRSLGKVLIRRLLLKTGTCRKRRSPGLLCLEDKSGLDFALCSTAKDYVS